MSKRKLKEHLINREWCKGCGIFEFCAKKFLELDSQDKAVPVRTYGLQHPATGKTMVCVPTEVSTFDLILDVSVHLKAERSQEEEEQQTRVVRSSSGVGRRAAMRGAFDDPPAKAIPEAILI